MAAPDGTVWGSTVGSYGRIGIYRSVSNTNTQSTVSIQVWFWSKYSVSGSSNTLYYNNNASTATTRVGSVSVSTSVSSGSGWSTSNQQRLKTYSYTYNRGTSSKTYNVAAKLSGIDRVGGTMSVKTSYTVPALASYTVKYNANGGSGAPGKQTKWYGTTLKLSSTKPTRTGYTFQGWSTANDSSVEYASGANYTSNSAVTLYAVWKANTYTVSYDANGGSGAPGNQTKTYGVSLTLSSVIPTRTNYNFLGWGTSAGATTIAYAPGAAYTGNTALTLYAIWELAYTPPAIDGFTADRCEADGTLSDDGTYAKIVFDWTLDAAYSGGIQSIMIGYKLATGDTYTEIQVPASGLSGSVSAIIGNGALDTEYSYDVRIVITDDKGSSSVTQPIPAALYTEDFLAGGKGVSFGAPAWREGMDIHFDVILDTNKVLKGNDVDFLGFREDKSPLILNNIGLVNGKWLQGQLASGSYANILRINESGQTELNWTSGGMKGRVFKQLWKGTWSSGSITIPDLPYYRFFLFQQSGGLTMIPVFRYLNANSQTGSSLRGFGGHAYKSKSGDRAFLLYGFDGDISGGDNGTSLAFGAAYAFSIYDTGGNPSNKADLSILSIYGVL